MQVKLVYIYLWAINVHTSPTGTTHKSYWIEYLSEPTGMTHVRCETLIIIDQLIICWLSTVGCQPANINEM